MNTEQLLAFDKIIVSERRSSNWQKGRPVMNEPYDLIQTVQLTEKATLLSEKHNKYVFRVSPRANKIQIKQAIELLLRRRSWT